MICIFYHVIMENISLCLTSNLLHIGGMIMDINKNQMDNLIEKIKNANISIRCII